MLFTADEPSSTVNADELFVKHSIPELRAYEKKTRSDIERKKQELRLMVGERYRDLTDAADSIVNMRHCALAIQKELHHMQDSCDVDALKRTVRTQINEDRKGTKAAQIKLLVDVPEQIWRSLESHKYLNASRLYLIAKLVYKNLQARNEDSTINVSATFPVVQRQWDAVSHFKTQILQKAMQHLKVTDQSEQSLAETLCSIMLLDDVTMRDVFRMCIDTRTMSLLQLLQTFGNNDTRSLTKKFKEMIGIVRSTVYHVGMIFMRAGEEMSVLESYLHQIQQGFTVHEDTIITSPSMMSSRDPKASLTRLYSPSTNIHLLIRYLPESIQTFTPFLHTSGARGQFSQEDITLRMNLWIEHIAEEFQGRLGDVLSGVNSASRLNELRENIWEVLKNDENIREDDQSVTKKHPSRIHRTSLGFILQIQKTEWSWNYIQDTPLSVFKSRIRCLVSAQTSFVGDVMLAFDKNLKEIKDDLEPIFSSLKNNKTDDPFYRKFSDDKSSDATSDAEELFHFFQDALIKYVTLYRNKLLDLLEEVNENSGDQDVSNAKRLLIGRIAHAIANDTVELPMLLQATVDREKPDRYSSFLSSPEPRLVSLREMLTQIYFTAHGPWIQYVTKNAQDAMSSMLNSSLWGEANVQTLVWEEVAMQPIEGEAEEKINLPSQPSGAVTKCLFGVCQEINRIGSPTLHESVIKDLVTQIFAKVIEIYSKFTSSEDQLANVSEKGAVQMLYDVKFLKKVFEPCWSLGSNLTDENEIREHQKKEQTMNQIMNSIRDKIDPIDLTIFEPHLNKNVERHYARSSIILGLILQLNAGDGKELHYKIITIQWRLHLKQPGLPYYPFAIR
ncbi:10636_t:CDS:10 [Acaulospora colombiana]|uniref:10636_t:CDS:1 n=1 Tax=Acaulospora colombiana TaxID=27376 RepID=A0ACA9JVQ8_9GLOM|nr:10636_t:CDS:10 [Acaulospora colombiana]